jgi:hypothetical protein
MGTAFALSIHALRLKTARRATQCPAPPSKKLSLAKPVDSILFGESSFPERGAARDRHGRGIGCGGRGSVGRECFTGRLCRE